MKERRQSVKKGGSRRSCRGEKKRGEVKRWEISTEYRSKPDGMQRTKEKQFSTRSRAGTLQTDLEEKPLRSSEPVVHTMAIRLSTRSGPPFECGPLWEAVGAIGRLAQARDPYWLQPQSLAGNRPDLATAGSNKPVPRRSLQFVYALMRADPLELWLRCAHAGAASLQIVAARPPQALFRGGSLRRDPTESHARRGRRGRCGKNAACASLSPPLVSGMSRGRHRDGLPDHGHYLFVLGTVPCRRGNPVPLAALRIAGYPTQMPTLGPALRFEGGVGPHR